MMNSKPMETMDFSDADLVAQSLAGSREAFSRIVARYQSLICAITYSATGNLNESEDLAQETFITAWKALAGLREPAKLRSWLCQISRNLTYDALKKQGREPSHDAETLDTLHESPAPEPPPSDQVISREEAALLWRSLEQIPPAYREPLTLYYREHQSVARVAEALELNEDTVKQRLSRGRKMLHEQVLAFVEGALERTSPGNGFTASVLSALPATTLSLKAASLGTLSAKAAAIGIVKYVLIFPLAIVGNYFGYRLGMDSAQTDMERDFIKGFYKWLLICVAVFGVAFAALVFWSMRAGRGHENLIAPLVLGLCGAYAVATIALGLWQWRRRAALMARLKEIGQPKPTRPAWEYRSAAMLLGMPLVHICIGGSHAGRPKAVIAWIAAADCAVGGLFAFGGFAMAPLSIGGMAVGLLPFGGMAVGLLVMGGFGVGVWSFAGLAIGWESFGGCAVAWNAACGGAAVAWNYALGSIASAAQVNNNIAHDFCQSQRFFRASSALLPYYAWLNLLWVLPLAQWWRVNRKNKN